MKIKIYSMSNCLKCQQLKEFLKEENIQFEDVNISDNERAKQEMIYKSKQNSAPVIEIRKSHSVGILVGFDKEILKQTLNIK